MYTTKPEFRVKDVIMLSKRSSEVLDNLLRESNIYLSRRILAYVLAQQISIQIASDRDLVHLRGYGTELEDYTVLQLLNFIDAQGIEVDTFDIKFRLWTVIFNNLQELTIKDSTIQEAIENSEEVYEYPGEVFVHLTRFIDESNDIDGQPFIIAKESLARFSEVDEIELIGKNLGVEVPTTMDKETLVNFVLRRLEDTNPDLKAELMNKTVDEIEEFARENFVSDDAKMSKKELVNFILDKYTPQDQHIREIEFEKFLEIPTLHTSQKEEETPNESFNAEAVFDDQLVGMIQEIVRGETQKPEVEITEEESKEELDSMMDKIASTYEPPKRESEDVLLKKIDELETRLAEKQSYDPSMIAFMNKIANMEQQLVQPSHVREDQLIKKMEELERKMILIMNGEDPTLSESQRMEKNLLAKIADLEEKLSFQQSPQSYTPEPEVDDYMDEVYDIEFPEPTVETEETVEEETPEFEVEADEDYEYDLDQFKPRRIPVQDLETEPIEEVEEVVAPVQSETERLLMEKLEEIERKLQDKDQEIAALKEASLEQERMHEEKLATAIATQKAGQISVDPEVLEDQVEVEVPELEVVEPVVSEPQEEVVESEEADEEILDFTRDEEVEEDSKEVTEEVTEEEVLEDGEAPETLEDIISDIEGMEENIELDEVHDDLVADVIDDENVSQSDFDKFIEEIHSTKDKDTVKSRRRHTVKAIVVFWKAAAIWAMLAAIGAIIIVVYNSL